MSALAATADDTQDSKPKEKPRGWLGKIFNRKAPWWIRVGRTLTVAFIGLMTIDNAVLPNMPGRHLTSGEETMLREVFHDSVRYNDMRIHQSAFADAWLHMMGQTAVARGNVVFVERTPDKDDYSKNNRYLYAIRDHARNRACLAGPNRRDAEYVRHLRA